MGSPIGLAAAVLASMVAGAFVVQVLHAQTKAPVYFVGEIDVTDPEGYAKEYLPEAREIIEAHGGQLVAAGGAAGTGNQVIPVDGDRQSASSSTGIQVSMPFQHGGMIRLTKRCGSWREIRQISDLRRRRHI